MTTKEEIISTRTGGLGSSDARMVAKIAKTGCLSDAERQRIAIMLGLEEKPQFSTEATENGNYIENRIFEIIKEKYPNVVSNPYYKSEKLSEKYGFDIINHIDYEVELSNILIWIENKATQKTFTDTLTKYQCQLSWHQMLLEEKAAKLNKKPILMLSHYQVYDLFDFDPQSFNIQKVDVVNYYNLFCKGFEIIQNELKDFKYEKRESLYADCLPIQLQDKIQGIAECLKRIEESEKQVDNFKERMLELMTKANVRSIRNDFFSINLIAETITTGFDKKLFEKENPELAEKYNRQSKRKSYVTIKTF